jgi:glutamate N-acetyltransferase/amino-acid N-acetyltransferase
MPCPPYLVFCPVRKALGCRLKISKSPQPGREKMGADFNINESKNINKNANENASKNASQNAAINIINGGITAAKGYEAAGVEAAIKYHDRKDMALIYSTVPCKAAGAFTTNVVKASPVLWDQELIEKGNPIRAIVVNSGIANACTGKQGMECCRETARHMGEALHVPVESVLVASTGVIGKQVPMDKMKEGIAKLVRAKVSTFEAGADAARAIMTTDTVPKQIAVTVEIGGKSVTIGGICKGSGMIHPNMCTLLAFLTTDISISKEMLKKAVSEDVVDTYNMISVDGDTSTNDTFLVLANALAGNEEIKEENEDYAIFCQALKLVNTNLAKMLAGDGEGATALLEVKVTGAACKEDARRLAKSVISSSLTKAAIFGHDANWGRIMCALGYSGAAFEPENVELFFRSKAGRIRLYGDGAVCGYSEEEATKILSQPEVTVEVDMHMGEGEACAWGCDLSYDYVKINADYRS